MVTGKPHKPSKFARFVLYPLGGAFFLVVLTVVLTLATGYRFIYSGGKVGLVKTGMLIVSTRPFDALVSLNGKATKYRTGFYLLPTKISSLRPGFYDVELSKSGYRSWKDRLEITPNLVTWANYVLLFPNKLNIAKIAVPIGNVIAKSDNGRHILFSGNLENKFSLKSLDSNNLSAKDFWPSVTPAETWLVSPVITGATYSSNNDRILLKITDGARTEYVVSDASSNQAKLIHLNSTLKQDFTEAWWNVANNNEIYLLGPAGLSLANINDTALANPILADIVSLKVDEARQVYYVTKNQGGTYVVGRMNLDGSNKTILEDSIAPSKSYELGFSSKNNILTILNHDTGDLTAYYIGNASKKYSLKLSGGVTSFAWSPNRQRLLYFGKNFVKGYDWEKNKETDVSLSDATSDVSWYFDENHYLINDTKGVFVTDYDGSNMVPISETPAGVTVLDQGNNGVLYTGKDDSGKEVFYKYISEF